MSKDHSPLFRCVQFVYGNSNCDSWQRLNSSLRSALLIAIDTEMKCEVGDVTLIRNSFRWGFWAGTSSNGHHHGECFYALGCQVHDAFAKVYEADLGRVPFILQNRRLYDGAEFMAEDRYWWVTGWSADNTRLHVVGYESPARTGRKKLLNFDRSEWLEFRKGAGLK